MAGPGGSGGAGGGSGSTLNPKQALELAEAIQKAELASRSVTSSFEQQLKIITQMREAMDAVSKNLSALCKQDCAAMSPDKWEKVEEKVGEYNKSLNKTSQVQTAAKKAAEVLARTMKSNLTKSLMITGAALDGLNQGFKNFVAVTRGILGLMGGIAKGAFNVGKAILAIPFKMLKGLEKAASSGGGGSELAQAYEDVREQFGSLKSGAAKTVIDVAKGMGKLDASGVSAFRIFGNLAQRIEAVNKLATAMGNTFFVVQGEFEKNGEAIMRYQRGLGITDEQMASVAQASLRMGSSAEAVLNDMTKQSMGMAKAFGVNAKVLSRDMAKALQDVSHFGSLSTKELAIAGTYAQKLGVSVDKLTASMDATKTFDSTTDAVSRLNEAFGSNIDAAELMAEENPAKQQEMIRKALQATGKDMSHLSRFEREMIKSTGLMGDEMIDAAFAAKNAGVSMDKISKQGDTNEKKTLSQADAMHELADSIKRIVPSGGGGPEGIGDALVKGFMKGISATKEYQEMIMAVRRVMQQAYMTGIKLGQMFVKFFPGVKTIFEGIKDLFSPANWGSMFGGVVKAFDILKAGGVGAMSKFMDEIKRVFFNFFRSESPAGRKTLEGFKTFGLALAGIFTSLGTWVVDALVKVIPKITEFIPKLFAFIKDPKKAGLDTKTALPEWVKPFVELFFKIKDELLPQLKLMFNEIWKGAKPYLIEAGWKYLKLGLLTIVAPAALRSVFGAAGSMLTESFGKAIFHAFTGGTETALAESGPFVAKLTGGLEKIGTKMGTFMESNAAKFLGKAAIVAAIATAAVDVGHAIDKYSGVLEKKGFDPATARIAAGTTGLINTLTFGLIPEGFQEMIAVGIASMSDKLFKTIEKWFGPSLSTGIKEYLSSAFRVFGGLGQLLSGLWSGDSKQVEKALGDIAGGLFDMFWMGLVNQFVNLPKTMIQLGLYAREGFYKLVGWLLHKGATIFHALEKLPIVGPLFGLVGDILDKLGTFYDTIASMFSKLQSVMKSFDIFGAFKQLKDVVVDLFKSGSSEGNSFLGSFISICKSIVAVLEEPFRFLRDFFNLIFSWDTKKSFMENMKDKWEGFKDVVFGSVSRITNAIDNIIDSFRNIWKWLVENFSIEKFKELGNSIIDGLLSSLGKLKDKVVAPFKDVITGVKTFLGIHSPSTVFSDMGGHIVDGLMESITEIPKRIKEHIGKVLTIFNDIFKMIVDSVGKNFDAIFGLVQNVTEKMLGYFETNLPRALKIFQDLKEGIFKIFSLDTFQKVFEDVVDGVKKAFGKLADFGPFNAVIEIAKKVFKISSPSKVFVKIGDQIVEGMAMSFEDLPDAAKKQFDSTVKNAQKMGTQLSNISPEASLAKPAGQQAAAPVGPAPEANPAQVEVAAKIIKMITDLITAISKAVGGSKPEAKVDNVAISAIQQSVPAILRLVEGIKSEAGPLVSAMIDIVKKVPTDANFKSTLETGSKLFEFIAKIPELSEKLSHTKSASGESPIDPIMNSIGSVRTFLQRLVSDFGRNPLQDIIDGMGVIGKTLTPTVGKQALDVSTRLTSLFTNLGTLGEQSAKLKDFSTNLKQFNDSSVDISKQITRIPESLDPILTALTSKEMSGVPTAAIQKSLVGLQQIVATIQKVDDTLAKLPKIDLSVRMGEVANKLGLGSSGVYTVQSKEVIINVTFNVSMDVAETEKIMVMRQNSIIRDRINFALGAGTGENKSNEASIPAVPSNTARQTTF